MSQIKEILGYPHVIVRTSEEVGQWFVAPETDQETGCTSPGVAYGWHGHDQPPCDGEWIAGLNDRYGAIVVTESPEPPSLPDGWKAEEFVEDRGWWDADESGWAVFLLSKDSGGECLFAGVGSGV